MRLRFFSLLLVPILITIPLALALGTDQAPGSDRWVDASFDLAQPTLTHIDLTGQLQIHKYLLSGGTQTATQMSGSYAATGDAFVADTEASMRADLKASLEHAFPGATIIVQGATIDKSSLTAARVDDYMPPILAKLSATIDRRPADVGIGNLTDDAVKAAFASGALVQTKPTLVADPGYRSAYIVHAPQVPKDLIFAIETSDRDPEIARATGGENVSITVDNLAGATVRSREVALFLHDRNATAPTKEDIRNTVDLTLGAPVANATTLPIAIEIAGQLRAIDLAARFPGVLPDTVALDYVNADGIRALYQAGAISDAQLASADASFLKEAKDGLSKTFGDDVAPKGGLSRSDLNGPAVKPYDGDPPMRSIATANATYAIPGDHAKDLDLALDIGATVRFNFTLYSADQESSFALHAPPGDAFTEARGGVLSSDQRTATFAVAAKAPAPVAGLAMRKIGAPTYTAENATLAITIDLQDLRVTLGQAAGGNFGTLVVDVTATGALDVVGIDRLPASVQDQVKNPNLDLSYLSGDAIRLAYARGLISNEQLATVESKLLDETASGLASGMGGPVVVTGGFDRASLVASAKDGTPVTFAAHSHFLKPVAGGAPTSDTSAVALKTITQSFDLKRVNGFATQYTIILPKGLDVAGVTPTGATATTGTAPDGRAMFIVTPESDQARATVAIAVTPTFILAKFWPVVLLALLVVLLLIGTPIALVAARRNKKKKA